MNQSNGFVKETASMAVYRELTELILEGHFEPGERIRERQIKDMLRISSTPIREAFKMLVHEDVLETIPHHGVRLRKLTVKEIRDFYELRAELESLAAGLAAERGDTSAFDKINQNLLKTKKLIKDGTEGEETKFIKYNNEFHRLIAEASQNHVLIHSLEQIQTKINMMRVYSWYKENDKRSTTTQKQHQLIFNAIKDRNSKLAREKVREHVLNRLEHELEMEKTYVKT